MLVIDGATKPSHNMHLFTESERAAIHALRALTTPALRLFIRLYQRTQKWERVSKLSYPDIATDLTPIINELASFNLALTESTIGTLAEALDLLLLPELRELCKSSTVMVSGKREAVIESIIKYCKTQVSGYQALISRWIDATFVCQMDITII